MRGGRRGEKIKQKHDIISDCKNKKMRRKETLITVMIMRSRITVLRRKRNGKNEDGVKVRKMALMIKTTTRRRGARAT